MLKNQQKKSSIIILYTPLKETHENSCVDFKVSISKNYARFYFLPHGDIVFTCLSVYRGGVSLCPCTPSVCQHEVSLSPIPQGEGNATAVATPHPSTHKEKQCFSPRCDASLHTVGLPHPLRICSAPSPRGRHCYRCATSRG